MRRHLLKFIVVNLLVSARASVLQISQTTSKFKLYTNFRENMYGLCDASWGTMKFYDADQACQSLGAGCSLIALASESDNALMTAECSNIYGHGYWIVLHDTAFEGTFVWTSGEDFSYRNFRAGEPNNYANVEDCVCLDTSSGGWNDCNCVDVSWNPWGDHVSNFVCQCPGPEPFPDRAALKTAVDSCLDATNGNGDPTGKACCTEPNVECGVAGTFEMENWDVSLVTDMSELFYDKAHFNADISAWDVSSVTNMAKMFMRAYAFNQDIGSWNTAQVTSMTLMFTNAVAFNQDIGSWNTASVGAIDRMFMGATAFNQDIGAWNTASVYKMNRTFEGATAFNQDITGWSSSSISDSANVEDMFKGATAWLASFVWTDGSSSTAGPPAAWTGACSTSMDSSKDETDGIFYCINGGTVGGTAGSCTCTSCNAGYERSEKPRVPIQSADRSAAVRARKDRGS